MTLKNGGGGGGGGGGIGPVTLKNDKKMTKMTLKTLSFTKNIGRHPELLFIGSKQDENISKSDANCFASSL